MTRFMGSPAATGEPLPEELGAAAVARGGGGASVEGSASAAVDAAVVVDAAAVAAAGAAMLASALEHLRGCAFVGLMERCGKRHARRRPLKKPLQAR